MPLSLRNTLLLILFIFFQTELFSQFWMQRGGSLNVDEAYDVAVDVSGNAYATGYFTGNATFGATNLASSGSSDIFIVKISNTGAYQWAVKAGGSGSDRGLSIEVDGSGNSYVTGYFNGQATFGSQTVTSSGQQDVFIAKYNTSGVLQWVKTGGGSNSDIGNGIALDNNNNVIVVGEFKGTSTFGSSTITSLNNSTDAFVTKLNSSGTFQWTKKGSGNFNDRGLDVGCDNSGNIYAIGQFSDTFAFDVTHNNTMFNAIFVIKFNGSGNEQWFKMIGGGNSNIANAIEVTSGGNVYITGDFTGNLTFFNTTNTNLTNTLSYGVFVARYTSGGVTSWAAKSASDNLITSNGIAVDNSGNPFIIGHFECSFTDYTDQYGEAIFNSVGYKDVYVSKFSGGGQWTWARHIASRLDDYGFGIDMSTGGQAHIAGSFKEKLFVPTSNNFVTSNLNNWTSYACTQPAGYCNDNNYGSYHGMQAAGGNSDAFIANCIDPNRQPYDYYLRSGSGCDRDIVEGCINAGCPDTVAKCNSVLLTAIPKTCPSIGPDLDYLWSNNQTNSQSFYSTTGYKFVHFTTDDGCFTYTDSVYVDILPGPEKPWISDDVVVNNPTPFPVKINVCKPDSVWLTASNVNVDSFYWTGPGLPAGGVFSMSVQVWETGGYYFTVVDEEDCIRTSYVDVEFFDPLDSFLLRANIEDTLLICNNENFKISLYDSIDNPFALPICFTDSQPFINTTWSFTPVWPAQEVCETFLNVTPMDTGWFVFSVELVRRIPCDTDTFYLTDSVYIIPQPSPEIGGFTIEMVGSSYYCPGETCLQYATGGTTYIWGGPFVNGSTNDSVYIGYEGTYTVSSTVYDTNQYGCIDSLTASASKYIQEKPQPEVEANTLLICPNDSVWLTVSNTGATEGFLWEGPNGQIVSDSNAIAVTDPGTYYCTVNDTDSCELASNSVVLTQYNTPSLAAGGDLIICDGDSVTLTVITSSGSSIEWINPATATGSEVTVYEPGIYTCKIVSCGIETYASIEVFPSYVEAEITPGGILCFDSNMVLYGSPGMSTYSWSANNSGVDSIIITEPGTYTLTTTDSNGCIKVSDPFEVVITQVKTVIGLDGYPVFCYDDSITLYGNEDMANYNWQPRGDTTQNIVSYEEGTFTLHTVDTNGCRGASEPLKVSIPDTAARFAIDGELAFCEGDSVSFRANRGGMAEYIWLPDSLRGRNITFYETGTYSLITYDTFGCDAWSTTIDVYMQPNDIAKPTGDDTLICWKTIASLNAEVNIGTLKWSKSPFGQVINEGTAYETPELYAPTPYYVWSDYKLCRGDSAIIFVDVQDCEQTFTPNIFTPNGDGQNDIFSIYLNEITCLELTIFNRWGVVLYQGSGLKAGWDGTNQRTGNPVPEGTYYFIAHYCKHNGTEGDIKSYLSLIRGE